MCIVYRGLFKDTRRSIIGLELVCNSFVENNISLVLQQVNLDDATLDFGSLDLVNACKGKVDLPNRLHYQLSELTNRLSRRTNLVQIETVYCRIDVV